MEKEQTLTLPALEIVRNATVDQGILASVVNETNYRRVWARDSVICGLAGLLSADEVVINGLYSSLLTLGDQQGPQGQIPSNVAFTTDGQVDGLSFGGLCGRADTIAWWLIGLGNYTLTTGDRRLAERFAAQVEKAIWLQEAWEFNGRGLLYVPQSGHWADEYFLHAYVLSDQLLRYWGLSLAARLYDRTDWQKKADQIKELISENFWIDTTLAASSRYHDHAYALAEKESGASRFWEASFSPTGYIRQFDLLANALTLLLDIGTKTQKEQVVRYVTEVLEQQVTGLVPSFWPVIFPDHPDWRFLAANHKYHFRNQPYQFQNGGIWPSFNGFWGMALVAVGEESKARQLAQAQRQAIALEDWSCYECLDGKTGKVHGTERCTWSAAGMLMTEAALNGKKMVY